MLTAIRCVDVICRKLRRFGINVTCFGGRKQTTHVIIIMCIPRLTTTLKTLLTGDNKPPVHTQDCLIVNTFFFLSPESAIETVILMFRYLMTISFVNNVLNSLT